MTQRERDRLVVLKKAQKKLITQRQAAADLQVSKRQVRRMLVILDGRGRPLLPKSRFPGAIGKRARCSTASGVYNTIG
jgi:predicted DNA-binding transcriptional regulator YafY